MIEWVLVTASTLSVPDVLRVVVLELLPEFMAGRKPGSILLGKDEPMVVADYLAVIDLVLDDLREQR